MKLRILLLISTLSFSGCALLYSYSENLPQRIDGWVAEKKYNTALNTISYIKSNHKDYRIIKRKKVIIQQKMLSYEKAAIEKSMQLSSQGEWVKAFNLIDEVSNNIVETNKIDKHRAILLIKRNKVISSYENEILYAQAKNLADKMKLYERISKTVLEGETNQLNISEFNNARKETILRLTRRSEQQHRNALYYEAIATIELAFKLNPDKEIASRLSEIKKRIKQESKQIKAFQIKEAKSLLSKLSQGYSHLILKRTKDTIKQLSKNKDNPHLELIRKLQKHLTAGVNQNFEAARSLYSKGKTQQALSIWLELKKLEPENPKLLSHIERAEKIMSKLKTLSNKPAKKK